MIEIEMSKDVREFEPKIIGPFSARQFLFILIACGYGIPFMILVKGIPLMPRVCIGMALMAPVLAFGFIRVFGMYLNTFFFRYIIGFFFRPSKRKYIGSEMATDEKREEEKIVRSKTIKGTK